MNAYVPKISAQNKDIDQQARPASVEKRSKNTIISYAQTSLTLDISTRATKNRITKNVLGIKH